MNTRFRISFNTFIYTIIFLVGALNYALMLGTLNLIVGHYPLLASLDLMRTESIFFLFIGFYAACCLVPAPKMLWTRRLLVLIMAAIILFFAHMAAALAQAMSEAGPMYKVLFYVNYLRSSWLTDSLFEKLILYVLPASLILLLLAIYVYCLNDEQGSQYKKVFIRNALLSVLFFALGFVSPFQKQMPYSLSHNALMYVMKTGYFPQYESFEYDPSIHYQDWKFFLDENLPKKNVVIILLESTQNKLIQIGENQAYPELTPNLTALSEESLVFTRAYGSIPHTSKALVSVYCGMLPFLDLPIYESVYGLPASCLPDILKQNHYRSAFIQPATAFYENRKELMRVFGFEEVFSAEDFRAEQGERSNPLGFDDEVMLEKTASWLDENQGKPFLLGVLTLTSHWPYTTPANFKLKHYVDDPLENAYINSVRYSDIFIGKLMRVFKDKQAFDNTIFVFMSDHGEAFGEHGEFKHNNNPYNEAGHVFFMIHDPQQKVKPGVEQSTVSQTQVAPSVLDMLGFQTLENSLAESVFKSTGKAFGSCYERLMCFYYVDNHYKYIYNFKERGPELYDIHKDPQEMTNLINDFPETANEMHEILMQRYVMHQSAIHNFYSAKNPRYQEEVSKTVLYTAQDMYDSLSEIWPVD